MRAPARPYSRMLARIRAYSPMLAGGEVAGQLPVRPGRCGARAILGRRANAARGVTAAWAPAPESVVPSRYSWALMPWHTTGPARHSPLWTYGMWLVRTYGHADTDVYARRAANPPVGASDLTVCSGRAATRARARPRSPPPSPPSGRRAGWHPDRLPSAAGRRDTGSARPSGFIPFVGVLATWGSPDPPVRGPAGAALVTGPATAHAFH